MEFGLTENHRKIINEIFDKYPQVKKVLVYGSRAKGNYREGSDIDMTIAEDEKIPFDVFLKIVNDFDDSMLPFLVDISIFSDLTNPDLKEHINRVGKVIYEKRTR